MRKLNYWELVLLRKQLLKEFYALCENGGENWDERTDLYIEEISAVNILLQERSPHRVLH